MEQIIQAAMTKIWDSGNKENFVLFAFLLWQLRGVRFELKKIAVGMTKRFDDGEKRFAINEGDIKQLKSDVAQLKNQMEVLT